MQGLQRVILRGMDCALIAAPEIETLERIAENWYESIIGTVPAKHWREVGMWASRYTKPSDKFTLGQFFEAWNKFCEQGRARGYEPWR